MYAGHGKSAVRIKKFQIRIQQNPNNPNLTSNFNEMFPITRILVLVTPIKCHSISFSCFIIGKTTKTNTKLFDFDWPNQQTADNFHHKKYTGNHVTVPDQIN